MSQNTILFSPPATTPKSPPKRTPHKAYLEYVERGKSLTLSDTNINWEANFWHLSEFGPTIHFTNFDTTRQFSATRNGTAAAMEQPFLDFAKAFIHITFARKPGVAFDQHLQALRALERVLSKRFKIPDVTRCNAAIFKQAYDLLKDKFAPSTVQGATSQLNAIAKCINDEGMVRPRFKWRQRIPRASECFDNSDPERRKRLLPTRQALFAMAEAFNREDASDVDKLVSSILAILVSEPGRIKQVLHLRLHCERTPEETNGLEYALRWPPAKGHPPGVKPVVTNMVDIVRKAITRIKDLTKQSREVAKWYEKNPHSIFLPRKLEHLRQPERWLYANDVFRILGVRNVNSWTEYNHVKTYYVPNTVLVGGESRILGTKARWRFKDIEKAVLKLLPKGFVPKDTRQPIGVMDKKTGLKFSEALFVLPKNFFHSIKPQIPCMFQKISFQNLYEQLGNTPSGASVSMFERLDLRESYPDGPFCFLRTHMLRRWLRTLVKRGGISDALQAKWAGSTVEQCANYDYTDSDLDLEEMEQQGIDGSIGTEEQYDVVVKIFSDPEFAKKRLLCARETKYGHCVRDYSQQVCQRSLEHLNCMYHICRKQKNKPEKLENAKQQLRTHEAELEKIEAERQAEGNTESKTESLDRWGDYHADQAEKLRQIIEIHEDPKYPDGQWFRIKVPQGGSRFLEVVKDHYQLNDGEAVLNDNEARIFKALLTKGVNHRKLLEEL